jgi:hypothetical protein
MLRRLPFVLLAAMFLPAPARAALDPETDRPYRLDIVLDVAKHRLLTDIFRQQVLRELRDGLRSAFGDLAEVRVLETHPLLAQVRKQGLKEALDRWLDLDGIKTHFVLIDYAAGEYVIHTRQHDGLTGQSSPIVRSERTADRQFVARLAALLVDRDFGLVGTVRGEPAQTAVLDIKGGQLGVPLDRWVKKGDVFVMVPVRPPAPAPRLPLGEAPILQVEDGPDKGVCKCRVFERYKRRPGAAGYRCLKLHTIKAPLRVRLMERNAATPTPVRDLRVEMRRSSFDKNEKPIVRDFSNEDGYCPVQLARENAFENVAFVTVETQPAFALAPVPIVDDVPVVLRVVIKEAPAGDDLVANKRLWDLETIEAGQVQRGVFKELQEFAAKPKLRNRALERAKQGLKTAKDELARLNKQKVDLVKKAQENGVTLDLTFGDQWLKALEKGNTDLENYIAAQEKILAEENNPQRQKLLALVQQARLEEGRAEFDKALELYNQALKEGLDDATLKAHRDDLASRWNTSNPDLRRARAHIYGTWPKADLLHDRDAVKEALAAFKTCTEQKDLMGPQKLLQIAIAHSGKLQEQSETLQIDAKEEDRKTAEVIASVSQELKKLITEVQKYLEQATGGK